MSQSLKAVPRSDVVAPATGNSLGRLDYLDGLRALAALYVVLHHMWLTIWPVEYHKYPQGQLVVLTSWLAYGHFAVSAFIVISGFCLMLPVVHSGGMLKGGWRRFFKKRAKRILPPYYFALGISALLALTVISRPTGSHWDASLPVTIPSLYAHIILLQDFMYSAKVNHVLWSVAVECQIYLLFPMLVILWRRIGGTMTTVGTLLISYAVYFGFKYLGVIPPDGASSIVPQYVGLFALGMAGAALAFGPSHGIVPRLRRLPWWLIAVCMMLVVCVLNGTFSAFDAAYSDMFVGIAITCALIGASSAQHNPLRQALSWRPLAFIGTMSYSLYLFHAPLLQIVWQYALRPLHLTDGATFAATLVIGTPLTLTLAYLFFLVCERPFLSSPPPLQPWIVPLASVVTPRRFLRACRRGTPPDGLAVEDDMGRYV